MKNPLTTTSILLHQKIRKWTGEVSDKKALAAVAKQFSSDTHDDKYTKSLFIGDPLAKIDRCSGRLRNWFYDCSVPWLDSGGGRLMSGLDFKDFADKHTELKNDFFNEVDIFITEYPEHKERAKEAKGDLYNEADYPSVEEVRGKFDVQLITLPFPNTEDFRIKATDEAIELIENNMEQSMAHVAATITEEFNKRFQKRLAMLLKTLRVGKRFNKSLLTELDNVISMAHNLEETVDAELLTKMKFARNNITMISPEHIRNSQTLQDDIAAICTELLD